MSNREQPDSDVLTMARGLMSSRVLLTAVELRVFDVLQRSSTAEDVAATLGTDPRATDRLLNALVGLGLITKDEDDRFENTVESWRFLVSESAESMVGPLRHYAYLWESWSELTEVVRTGKPVRRERTPEQEQDRVEAFMAAMDRFAQERAPAVVRLVDLSEAATMLDIGGGPATYSIAFCRRYPNLRVTLFDLPAVAPIAKERIDDAGLAHRIRVQTGDFHGDPFDGDYDFALLSHILHSNSPGQNRALLAKTFAALAPGGVLLVQDFFTDDSKALPPFAALFGINMLVNTETGDVYSETEITDWLLKTGFEDVSRLEGVPEADALAAWKPVEE